MMRIDFFLLLLKHRVLLLSDGDSNLTDRISVTSNQSKSEDDIFTVTSSLVIVNATEEDDGVYTCTADNTGGEAVLTQDYTVTVEGWLWQ